MSAIISIIIYTRDKRRDKKKDKKRDRILTFYIRVLVIILYYK
jgi:hypothetical protein